MTPGRPIWWQRLIPRYGAWGGPGWSAGEWNPEKTNWGYPPVDEMDAAFREHDRVYQNYRTLADLDLADGDLVASLKQIRVRGLYAKVYRIGAIIAFTIWPRIRFFR